MPPIRPPRTPLPARLQPDRPRWPETHQTANAPWATPPAPIATGARTLTSSLGVCSLCDGPLFAGQRAADLADGRTVHTACAASHTG
jgi:hypothetical protein